MPKPNSLGSDTNMRSPKTVMKVLGKELGMTTRQAGEMFLFKDNKGVLKSGAGYLSNEIAQGEAKSKLHNLLVAKMILAATGYKIVETKRTYVYDGAYLKKYEDSYAKRVGRFGKGRLVGRVETEKYIPANTALMQYLMDTQFADGIDGWKGWRQIRESLKKSISATITGSQTEVGQIDRFAGGLLNQGVVSEVSGENSSGK